MYDATRASFNELFPRLRPGGVYMIEDWPWAHTEPFTEMWADRVPLTRLVLELVIALPSVRGLVSEIRIDRRWVLVTRGDASVDPDGFEISDCQDQTGRGLLAADPRVSDRAGASTGD